MLFPTVLNLHFYEAILFDDVSGNFNLDFLLLGDSIEDRESRITDQQPFASCPADLKCCRLSGVGCQEQPTEDNYRTAHRPQQTAN
jgi:hypothetical protein